jgi:predicted transcriptional regulator
MDISSLKEAGLTDGEIKVYLALLELGPSTTGPIIKKSGIARSIIYEILERLLEKGLISYIVKEKTKHYQAAEPGKILEYIDERDKRLHENKRKVGDMLPKLLALTESSKGSSAQIYEGFRGIRTVHEHTYLKLKRGEEYVTWGIAPLQTGEYHAYWQKDHVRRNRAGIRCKLLFNQGTEAEILKNRNSYKGCDARYMQTKVHTPAWFMTYKDVAVIVLQKGKGIAIEITNQEIADSFKAYFEEFWKDTEPFK